MELLIGGQWTASRSGREEEVTSPFDGAGAGSVPVAGVADVDAALTAAVAGAKAWRNTPGHEGMRIQMQAAAVGLGGVDVAVGELSTLIALSSRFRKDLAGSGALGDLLSHVVDLVQYVVGPSPTSPRSSRRSTSSARCCPWARARTSP